MEVAIAVDVGGTNMKLGIINSAGELLKKIVYPTRSENKGKYIVPDIAKAVAGMIREIDDQEYFLLGVGVGMPGPVLADGFVKSCVNLNVGDINLSTDLSETLGGVHVYTGNDANMAALGEMWKGGGKGYDSLMLVTLGTGVGSGVVLNGRTSYGGNGIAGEIGHIRVNPHETDDCSCGKRGCLDQVASATGIVRYAKRFMRKTSLPSSLREKEHITAKEIFDKAQQGDSLAYFVIDYCMSFLGECLSDVSYVIDPQAFIIGGGVSQAGSFLTSMIKRHYKNNALFIKGETPIVEAVMGSEAGMYGAAKMVFDMEAERRQNDYNRG